MGVRESAGSRGGCRAGLETPARRCTGTEHNGWGLTRVRRRRATPTIFCSETHREHANPPAESCGMAIKVSLLQNGTPPCPALPHLPASESESVSIDWWESSEGWAEGGVGTTHDCAGEEVGGG